jgi:hypothetical protein
MFGLDYEPRNTKEKWLMRIVYWGTILLLAFIFWEIREGSIRTLALTGVYTNYDPGASPQVASRWVVSVMAMLQQLPIR